MASLPAAYCPVKDNVDRRKSAHIAQKHTKPDPEAHWVKSPFIARKILRSTNSRQAGAGADLVSFKNPEEAPVFFLDGEEHTNKRRKTQRFLSPKAISEQHVAIMRTVTNELVEKLKSQGHAKLEDLSFKLAVDVVGEILGLTNSNEYGRAKRIERVLRTSARNARSSALSRLWFSLNRIVATASFYWFDVRPAIKHRKKQPKDDAISFYLEENYSRISIVIECLTYGAAGMLTTREFIIMAAWYLFEDEDLRNRFLAGEIREQLEILMEIVRLEPVAAMIHRRIDEEIEGVEEEILPSGEKYGIDIRAANVDEEFVGECPFSLDPDRAKRQKDTGRFMSFGDGRHSCPGWQVALQETRIFLEQLFRVPGIKLDREPDISWNAQLGSYELRNADISCERSA
jgi:cytochrome P450